MKRERFTAFKLKSYKETKFVYICHTESLRIDKYRLMREHLVLVEKVDLDRKTW